MVQSKYKIRNKKRQKDKNVDLILSCKTNSAFVLHLLQT